jgi:hypothetical protein
MIGNEYHDPRIIPVGGELPPMDPAPPRPHRRGDSRDQNSPKGKHSSRGRFQCVNAFLDVTMGALERAELAVWLLLWRDTKPDGLARTSQSDLARRAGCNPRTVRRALTALQSAGLVSVVRRGGLNRGLSVYRVHPLAGSKARERSHGGHGRPRV